MKKIAIIGTGKAGKTIGRLLQQSREYRVEAVADHHYTSAQAAAQFIGNNVKAFRDIVQATQLADIIFVTTPDMTIKAVCDHLASHNGLRPKSIIIHCSGNFSSNLLKSAKAWGVFTASLHPLQTFAEPAVAVKTFAGTYCAYEGDRQILGIIKNVIKSIGGVPVKINGSSKPLYHIAGVIFSNYLVTLINIGLKFLRASGFDARYLSQAFLPLVGETIKNTSRIGPVAALTGPISRGDIVTIKSHLNIISRKMPAHLHFYKALGKHTIEVALKKKSINQTQARQLMKLFSGHKP